MTAKNAAGIPKKSQSAIKKLLDDITSLEDVARVMSNHFSHCGLRALTCDFDGSGDSCDCFDVRVSASTDSDCIEQSLSRFLDLHINFGVTGVPEIARRDSEHIAYYRKALHDKIETLLFAFIAIDNTGWEIDDGGSGRVQIDFLQDKLSFEITVREMTYRTTERTHCISTGKELSSRAAVT
jgi:hypothetical protein